MGRSSSCWSCSKHEDGLNRGAWTASEDKILSAYIKTHGVCQWRDLPRKAGGQPRRSNYISPTWEASCEFLKELSYKLELKFAGLKRGGKSCRLRWLNYLRPDIKRGNISPEEEELIVRLHRLLGNRWSLIAGRLPGRTDNEIKNHWNTHLSKRVQMGEFERRFQKPFKRRDISSSSNYDGVVHRHNYTFETLPLKTRAVRYCGRPVVDGDVLDSYDYAHVQNGINQEGALKAADGHVVEIDTSKSWFELLLENCMDDYKYDLLEAINGLQQNSKINYMNDTDDHHQSPSPSLRQSIILQENNSSSDYNLIDQELPPPKDFNSSYLDSLLDLGEPSILPP